MARGPTVVFDGEELEAAIRRCGKPREFVAYRAQISVGTVNRALNGERITLPVAAALARAVGGKVRDLTIEQDREAAGSAA